MDQSARYNLQLKRELEKRKEQEQTKLSEWNKETDRPERVFLSALLLREMELKRREKRWSDEDESRKSSAKSQGQVNESLLQL